MIGVGRRHRHGGRAGGAIGHCGIRLDDPAGLGCHPFAGAVAAVGIERPAADHPLERIPADPLVAAGFGHPGDGERVVAKEEITVVFPAVADRGLPLGALVDPIADEERHPGEHLGRRRRRIIGKLAVGGDRPGIPHLVADGRIADLSGDVGVGDSDQPHPLLDRQAVADGADARHLHLELSFGKSLEKSLEKPGDLLAAGKHVAILVDELPLLGEERGEGCGIPLVEGLDRGELRLLDRLNELRRRRRGLDDGHFDDVDFDNGPLGGRSVSCGRCRGRRNCSRSRPLPGRRGPTEKRPAQRTGQGQTRRPSRRHRHRSCRRKPATRRTVHAIPLKCAVE